jgi:hypothetical protein
MLLFDRDKYKDADVSKHHVMKMCREMALRFQTFLTSGFGGSER